MILDANFIDRLASSDPAPGGGGAACLVGALAVALAEMDAHLTLGKERFREFEEDCARLLEQAGDIRMRFVALIDEDAQSFLPVSKAYTLPHQTEEQKAYKAAVLESSLKVAVQPPLEALKMCLDVLMMHKELALRGSRLAVSDAGCGSELCRAVARCSYMNVLVNTKLMRDCAYAEELNAQAFELLNQADMLCNDVFGIVCEALSYKELS